MSYATDGKCHNSNRGTFNHECGKPAEYIGTETIQSGEFSSGFCAHCKQYGDEARAIHTWRKISKRSA